MASSIRRRLTPLAAIVVALGAAPHAVADDQQEALGYLDLIARLGSGNEPTGETILAGHTEAPDSNGNYAPNFSDAHFTGKTFTLRSGSSGVSNHANEVGRHYYGDQWGAAPGVLDIHVYEANGWLQNDFLRLGQGSTPPLIVESDLFNNSWIGTTGSPALDNEILRRLDDAVNDQGLLIVCGVGNGDSGLTINDILLSHNYNGISVGKQSGRHHHGNTLSFVDGSGRMKPEIVGPDGATSWNSGLVASVVTSLLETARTWDGLSNNDNADRPEVIKAALLAGAVHRDGWSNNPDTSGPQRGVTSTPLDPVYGVDLANINFSHVILTGLEQDGSIDVPLSGSRTAAGWDLTPISSQQSRFYRFEISQQKAEASFLITWNRQINGSFTSFSIPNIQLELFAVDPQGNLESLRGSAGLDDFGAGNIASVSDVDNVEHLYIRNLAPGDYVLRVRRTSDALATWDVAVAWLMDPDAGSPADLLDFDVVFGSLLEGVLSDLFESDDRRIRLRSQFGFQASEPNLTDTEFLFDTDVAAPQSLRMTIESRLNHPGGIAKVRFRNTVSGFFEQIHEYPLGTDETVETVGGIDATRYVAADGSVETSVKQIVVATFSLAGFEGFYDFVGLDVF